MNEGVVKPELFGYDSYVLAIGVGVALGTVVNAISIRREMLPVGRVLFLLTLLPISSYVGAKAMSMAERGWTLDGLSLELAHGLRYPGGILGFVAGGVVALCTGLFRGFSILRLADALSPGIAAAMMVVRVGCLLTGCCYGSVTTLPWGISYPWASRAWGDHVRAGLIGRDAVVSDSVHPFPVIMIAFYCLLGATLWRVGMRNTPDGFRIAFCITSVAGARLLANHLRATVPDGLFAWDLAALGCGIALLLVVLNRNRQANTPTEPLGAARVRHPFVR